MSFTISRGDFLHNFSKSQRGTVSIYLILIIVPIFFFQAVLIDFARIKLAEKESETAVKTAVRSVMSAYEPDLQAMGLYGLGLNREETESVFSNVFAQNLSSSVSPGSFHYVDNKPLDNASRITPVYSLASHVIFKQQILEDMKIKAPIEYTLEILDKFKKSGASDHFQEGSEFSQHADELGRLLEQREEALDEAWRYAEEMHAKTLSYHTFYQDRIRQLDGIASQVGVHTIDGVRSELNNVKVQLTSVQKSISDANMSIVALSQAGAQAAASIGAIIQNIRALEAQARALTQKQSDLERIINLLLQYAELITVIKQEVVANGAKISELQQRIEPVLRKAKQKNDEIREKLGGLQEENGNQTKAYEAFQSIVVYGDDYFYNYQTAAAEISALFTAFQQIVESVYLYTTDNTNKALTANDAYNSRSNDFYGKQNALEQARMSKSGSIKQRSSEQKNKIQVVLDQVKQSIGGCSMLLGPNSERDYFQRLQGNGSGNNGYYQKYREVNAQESSIGSEIAYDLDKSETASLKAMNMLSMFTQAAATLRDELYVNEFALTKFNYRTYGLEQDASGNPKVAHEIVDVGSHMLTNQEVEYLIYGFSSCAANMSSAYAEMFSFRLAIRTLEALMDPEKELLNIGSPLLVFLTAAAEGAVKALQDMQKLTKGDAVELTSKLSVSVLNLTYKDYLRIFLLMHSNNEKLMARMQALIELQTGKNLLEHATYMQGSAVSSIRLWFIPQLMKIMDNSGLLGCQVVRSRCQMTSIAAFAY
ncbi:hypothetical protein [Paenibacillus aestuarii]|uniref:Methyl-accepting chemotaxis protein n=1 Tax=Paenibacillus aestuarii TaxID=516965 RepID=A0ABW0KKC8_9BACL|nr:hypothetical protein [Paenibacillus aestuarii]